MKPCHKSYCLNHDRTRPFNCQEYGQGPVGGERCCGFVSADFLMRTYSPCCHRTARGRWVSDKTTVFR